MARAPRAEARPAGRSLADLAESAGSVRSRRTPDPGRRPPWRFRRLARRLLVLLGLAVLLGAAGLGGVAWYLDEQGRPPREWAPYLERRAKGHNPVVLTIADLAARYLRQVDQLERTVDAVVPPRIGAGVERSGAPVPGMARLVQTTAQLAAALASATPGQVILLVPGTYRIDGRGLVLNRAGTAAAPIVLRAERLGDATLLSSVVEMLKVSAPHWTIENLVARGVCGSHGDCEHAVHVVGAAEGVVIRNNRFEDFNAHIKINGEGGAFPDNGVIAGNTLVDSAPRATGNPVTPIDLVAASNWRISGNFIADFQRDG
ncbi:MAG: hypothetical protein IT555_08640, partial [Acetobacteraceae bacterium]|nr:hypothetical protein [Acetobacteraceae bacterium]